MPIKFKINLKSSNKESLFVYKMALKSFFKKLNLKYVFFDFPKKRKFITLNKSPHVNKTAREQFELITYKCTFFISNFNKNIPLKYLFLNVPKTVSLKIEKMN